MHAFDLKFVSAPTRVCKIRVGRGVLAALVDDLVESPPGDPLIVVADTNVAPLHAAPLAARLRSAGLRVEELVFSAGESNKSRATKADLEDRLLELGVGRHAAFVAVGGGVTGDLVGFVAASWHRGVPVVQVPTSLLAMVDASVGGKTAVNLAGGKNLVGAFHQPWGVYADTSLLATLGEQDYLEGFAEVIKAGTIANEGLFGFVEASVDELKRRDDAALERVVLDSIRVKSDVVIGDEFESGRRAVLNFGHTVAHAIETVSGYTERHGPAVSVGMCVEARLAVDRTGFPGADCNRLEALLGAMGLPVRIPGHLELDDLVAATYRDKKVLHGEVHYALPIQLGRMPKGGQVTVAIDDDTLRQALADATPL